MRHIDQTEKMYLLSIKPDDITDKVIYDLFSNRAVKTASGETKIIKSKFDTNDRFKLKKGEYFNKEDIETTVGRFIFNKLVIESNPKFIDILGYVNEVLTDKGLNIHIQDKLAIALRKGEITTDHFVQYLDTIQWLGGKFASSLTNSITINSVKTNPVVDKRKKELMKIHADKLKENDIITTVQIEQELVALAKKELANDPAIELYNSGARGSFENNYKDISIMQGPVYNPVTGQFDIVTSNFVDGMEKKDIPSAANSVVMAAEPKAVGTQVAGYLTKKINAVYQSVVIDERKEDCGTKNTLDILVTKFNMNDIMYSYAVHNGKIILLDEKNISSFLGSIVKLRNPMFCIGNDNGNGICPICAGQKYTSLGITTMGLTATKTSSTILNLNMKKVHDANAKIKPVDLNRITL